MRCTFLNLVSNETFQFVNSNELFTNDEITIAAEIKVAYIT
jgi:hypothetical protein